MRREYQNGAVMLTVAFGQKNEGAYAFVDLPGLSVRKYRISPPLVSAAYLERSQEAAKPGCVVGQW